MRRACEAACIAALLAALAAGCTRIVTGDTEGVSVDVGWIGEIAPSTRSHLAWPVARRHCAAFGRSARVVDLRGSVAVYRCVAAE